MSNGKFLRRGSFICIAVTFLFFALPVSATQDGEEDMLGGDINSDGVSIEKGQIAEMLKMMKANGQISAEDEAKAQIELSGKSDSDMKNLQKEAMKRVESGNIPTLPPVSKPAMVETQKIKEAPPEADRAPASVITEATVVAKVKKDEPAALPSDRTKSLKDALNFLNK